MAQDTTGRGLVVPAIILTLGIVLSAGLAAKAYERGRMADNEVSVTGSAEREIESDVGKWSFRITRTAEGSALQAGTAQLKKDVEEVRGYLRGQGVKETEISVQPPQTSIVCDSQQNVIYGASGDQLCGGNRIVGYSFSQNIVVETREPGQLGKIAEEATNQLAGKGIVLNSGGVEFFYSKLRELKLEMLGEATKDATERARKIVESADAKLGAVRSAGMGVFQVTAPNSIDISDYGAYDTSSIKKKVTAIVRASYAVK